MSHLKTKNLSRKKIREKEKMVLYSFDFTGDVCEVVEEGEKDDCWWW